MRNILVIRTGAVGDFVLTLPALRALREAFPAARLEIMGYPSVLELALRRYYAERITPIDRSEMARFFIEDAELPREQANYFRGFDLILVYSRDLILVHNLRRTGARQVVLADPLPPHTPRKHTVDHLLDALLPLNVRAKDGTPRLFPSLEDRKFAGDFLKTHNIEMGEVRIAVHPGSGSPKKRWPPEKFSEAILRILDAYRAKILLISGPADREVSEQIKRETRLACPVLVQHISLPRLAALLEGCHLFLGNDSGVTHIAAAVGTPTVALFGPTDPQVWGPRGEDISVVQDDTACSPCALQTRDRCTRQTCLKRIPVDDVLARVDRLLAEQKIIAFTSSCCPISGASVRPSPRTR